MVNIVVQDSFVKRASEDTDIKRCMLCQVQRFCIKFNNHLLHLSILCGTKLLCIFKSFIHKVVSISFEQQNEFPDNESHSIKPIHTFYFANVSIYINHLVFVLQKSANTAINRFNKGHFIFHNALLKKDTHCVSCKVNFSPGYANVVTTTFSIVVFHCLILNNSF